MAFRLAPKLFLRSNLLPSSLIAARQAYLDGFRSKSRLLCNGAFALHRGEFPPTFPSATSKAVSSADLFANHLNNVNNMSPFTNTPFADSSSDEEDYSSYGEEDYARYAWDSWWTEEGLCLRFPMPGFAKENVKAMVEGNTLTIKGERETEEFCRFRFDDDDDAVCGYDAKVVLPGKLLKFDQTKAEMKDDILMVLVPKVKEEERTDVFPVKIV